MHGIVSVLPGVLARIHITSDRAADASTSLRRAGACPQPELELDSDDRLIMTGVYNVI